MLRRSRPAATASHVRYATFGTDHILDQCVEASPFDVLLRPHQPARHCRNVTFGVIPDRFQEGVLRLVSSPQSRESRKLSNASSSSGDDGFDCTLLSSEAQSGAFANRLFEISPS